TLRGWLSPLVWSFSRPYADKVARALIEAVEEAAMKAVSRKRKSTLQSEFF
ncbi:MAG: SRPBCC family protein, partial [Rivularia sp. ALOHA_DT_140]|nr:SRPBCC family protein [Rivularia sp. ALOHA_DT_140]